MGIKLFRKKIKALNSTEAKEVLRVLTSKTVATTIKAGQRACPSYNCCPCDSKSGGSCSCEDYCHCTKNKYINLRNMEIYECLRNVDPDTSKKVAEMLRAKIE